MILSIKINHNDITASNGSQKRYIIRLAMLCGESAEVPQNIVDDRAKQLAALMEVASSHISSKLQDFEDECAVLRVARVTTPR